MKATLPEKSVFNAKYFDNKETVRTVYGVVSYQSVVRQAVTVEWYMGRSSKSSVVYCNIWVNNACSGTGKAGGGGYCKRSAAFSDALRSAGIEIDEAIDGRGLGVVGDAVKAISLTLYPGSDDCLALGV